MQSVVSADLGGTKCRLAYVAEDFSVHGVRRFATDDGDRDRFLADLDAGFAALLRDRPPVLQPPQALGIGLAGVVLPGGREIAYAPNLPLDGFALAAHVEGRTGLRTVLLNDGRASAFGEYLRGNAQGSDPLLCLFFGTGIGCGLMVGGRPYGGADNAAGEIGHLGWGGGDRVCACGGRGHYEAYCGGRAIAERGRQALGPAPSGDWTAGALEAEGSAAAAAILRDAAEAAATLTANACTLLNPRAVVLGGGVLAGWPSLRQHIEREVRRRCAAAVTRELRFVESLGGSDAILWGAAAACEALGRR